jgi:hypothetical protein
MRLHDCPGSGNQDQPTDTGLGRQGLSHISDQPTSLSKHLQYAISNSQVTQVTHRHTDTATDPIRHGYVL